MVQKRTVRSDFWDQRKIQKVSNTVKDEWGSKEGETQKNQLNLCYKGKTEIETKGSRGVNSHRTKTPISV